MEPPPYSSQVTVLVADDTESELDCARQALEEAGYRVLTARDGQQALEQFGQHHPDLILLDVVMPRLTGLEVCRIVKAQTRQGYVPVVLVSTRNTVNARVEGLRCGADDYLGKPYDPEELRARVEALLRTRRAMMRASGPQPAAGADEGPARGRMEEEFDRAERYNEPLACLRVDLEGDPGADAVADLRATIASCVRKIDLVYRAGQAGYLLLLPNTHFPGALSVAERIWRRSREARPGGGDGIVSVGVSFFPNRDTHSLEDLLELVDTALTRARAEGGGKICLYQHQGYLYVPEGEAPGAGS